MSKFKDFIERINYGLFLMVVCLLPFPQVCLRYACVAWFITWALEFRWLQISNLKSQISNPKRLVPFILFGLWYAWKGLSFFWCADSSLWAWQIERYMTFLFIIPVGIWGVNSRYDIRQIGFALILGCLAAVFFYVGLMTVWHIQPSLSEHFNLSSEWQYHDNWFVFFRENVSHFKHRLFLGTVELLGAIAALRLFRRKGAVLLPCLAIMLSIIVLSNSRQAIISGVILAVMELIFALPERHKTRNSIVIVSLAIAGLVSLMAFHPRMRDFNYKALTEIRTIDYQHDIRVFIWGFALQEPQDYLAHGLGAGQSTDYLIEKYMAAGFPFFAEHRLDCHNQYLEELMDSGIPGLILFLLAWLSIPLFAPKKSRQIAWLFTVLFMLNMCTECMFGRFCGIAIWAVAIVLIYRIIPADTDV